MRLAWEFQHRLHKNIGDAKTLVEADLDTAINLFSCVAPISRAPLEIQEEILLLAIQANSQSPVDLMLVCRPWRNLILNMSRLWSSLKVGAWTAQEAVTSKVERSGDWPLEVEINSKDEVRGDLDPAEQYKVLLTAIKTMSRWKSLILVAFSTEENSNATSDEDRLVLQLGEPLSRLESFIMLDSCLSSPFVCKLLSIIRTASKDYLKVIQVPCSCIILSITGPSNDYNIFHNLTILKVHTHSTPRELGTTQSLELLPHLKHLEVLELTSTNLPDYRSEITLPLVKTLRQLTLKATSIQWLFGRTLSSLLSCTIISPHCTDHLDHKKIDLPLCEELLYDGHPLNALCHFLLPAITQLGFRNNEWTKKRANQQLGWMRLGLEYGQFQGISVLSMDLVGFSGGFLKPLAHLSCLRDYTLRVTAPIGIDCGVLRKICAQPLVPFDKPDGDQWYRWSKKMGEWRTSLWPLLTTFQLKFKRWFRDTERETVVDVVPFFAAIAWTRARLNNPLQCFGILVEGTMKDNIPLELVGDPLRAFILNGTSQHGHSEEELEAVVAFVLLKKIETRSQDTLRFLSQPPCRSVLRNLQALKLHRMSPRDPTDVLLYFESLEVLEADSLHIPIHPPGTELALVRTLKRLMLRHMSIQWMVGRRFKKLAECSIWDPILVGCEEGHVIEMPVCTHLLFGNRTLEGLGLFRFPSPGPVKLTLMNPWLPDLPSFAHRWIEGMGVLSKAMGVTSLQLEVGIFDDLLITILGLQPGLEELVLRAWGCDGLEMLLNALILNNDMLTHHGGWNKTTTTDSTEGMVYPLCPHLQSLKLDLENFDYEKKRNTLLPLYGRILASRRSSGRALQHFKISWGFGRREEQMV